MNETINEEAWEQTYRDIMNNDERRTEIITSTAETTMGIVKDQFHIDVDGDHRLLTTIFFVTVSSIIDELEKLTKTHDSYYINIADQITFGFNDSNNDDDEKNGNIAIDVTNVGGKVMLDNNIDPSSSNLELCVQWNAANITKDPEAIKRICVRTLDKLSKIGIHLPNTEVIMPIFSVYYTSLVTVMKLTFQKNMTKEDDDVQNLGYYVVNLPYFGISARQAKDGSIKVEVFGIQEGKLSLKSDDTATSKYE